MAAPHFEWLDETIVDIFLKDPSLQDLMYGSVDRDEIRAAMEARRSELILQGGPGDADGPDQGVLSQGGPVSLRVSQDKLMAWVELSPGLKGMGAQALGILLQDTLRKAGICYGLQDRQLDRLAQNPIFDTPILAARGIPPREDSASMARFAFDPSPSLRPVMPEHYGVSIKRPDFVHLVRPGDLLCTRPLLSSDRMGRTVYGSQVSAPHEGISMVEPGENVNVTGDGRSLFSLIEGEATFREGVLSVQPILRLPKVDAGTGDIKYAGSVYVAGSVDSGTLVEAAGNVIVGEYLGCCSLTAGGHLAVGKGIKGGAGSIVQVAGSLRAPYLEYVNADVSGDLYADVVFCSEVYCNGGVYALGRRGRVLGGHCAALQIEARELGNAAGTPTELELLSHAALQERATATQREVADWEQQQQHLRLLIQSTASESRQAALHRLLAQVEQKYAHLAAAADFLEQRLRRLDAVYPAQIKAYGALYPGVDCTLGGLSWSGTRQYNSSVVVRGKSEIEIRPLR